MHVRFHVEIHAQRRRAQSVSYPCLGGGGGGGVCGYGYGWTPCAKYPASTTMYLTVLRLPRRTREASRDRHCTAGETGGGGLLAV